MIHLIKRWESLGNFLVKISPRTVTTETVAKITMQQ